MMSYRSNKEKSHGKTIKKLSIAIIRNDENIWIKYKDDEYFELQLQ